MEEIKNVRTRRRSVKDFFTIFDSTADQTNFRIVNKNGDTTLKCINHPILKKCCYPNVFISVVELDSVWICLIFLTCFLLSWFLFAFLYFILAESHGDLLEDETTSETTPCVYDVKGFLEMFMFSMETQTTIGYGTRYVTEECPLAILLVIFQSILGSFLVSVLTGVVLFKFQEPSKRAHTVLFSKVTCVYQCNDNYFIEVQVLNMQRSQLIDPSVSAVCVMNLPDGSGKCRLDMKFDACTDSSRLFFRPRIYKHLINETSPFWKFDRRDFEKGDYEIIVIIDGQDEHTDSFVQVRTSFLPTEVIWGRHFKPMTATRHGQRFKLNFKDFRVTKRSLAMTDDSASVASQSRRESMVSDEEVEMTSIVNNVNQANHFINP